MGRLLEIRMQTHEIQCHLCCRWSEHHWSVPTFNGELVSNDFPDLLWHSGGGAVAVCERCYDMHAVGKIETFDRHYLHLAGGFIHGEGI